MTYEIFLSAKTAKESVDRLPRRQQSGSAVSNALEGPESAHTRNAKEPLQQMQTGWAQNKQRTNDRRVRHMCRRFVGPFDGDPNLW